MPLEVQICFVDEAARRGDAEARELLTPRRATSGSAGFDLVAANLEPIVLEPGAWAKVPTGVAIALPPGHEAQVRPRSGLSLKHGVTCLNAPGTIDEDYRGEVCVLLINHGREPFKVRRGMRIAQLVVAAVVPARLVPVDVLSGSERGEGGFGSTGGTEGA